MTLDRTQRILFYPLTLGLQSSGLKGTLLVAPSFLSNPAIQKPNTEEVLPSILTLYSPRFFNRFLIV